MVFELVVGFLVLVAASYLGTTMALRGFFGRERYDGNFETAEDDPPASDNARRADDEPRTDGVPRASDVLEDERERTDSGRGDDGNR